MSNDKGLVSRIPFEEIKTVSAWDMPNMDRSGKVIPSVKREDKQKRGKEVIEDVAAKDVKPVTAEQLAKVTEEAEKQAREDGYAKGYEQGVKQGEKKGHQLGEQKAYRETKQGLAEKQAAFESIADTLFQPATRHDALLENAILDIATQLAKHLLGAELGHTPALLYPVIEQAVAALPAGTSNICVFVHPDDLQHIEDSFAGKRGDWRFMAEPSLARGGCKVESATGAVDYSVEHRLEQWLLAAEQKSAEPPEPLPDYRSQHQKTVEAQLPSEPEIAEPTENNTIEPPVETEHQPKEEPNSDAPSAPEAESNSLSPAPQKPQNVEANEPPQPIHASEDVQASKPIPQKLPPDDQTE